MWAIIMASLIIGWLVFSSPEPDQQSWVGTTLAVLLGIIGGYIAADSLTKPRGGDE